jgi:hypothetical protein
MSNVMIYGRKVNARHFDMGRDSLMMTFPRRRALMLVKAVG